MIRNYGTNLKTARKRLKLTVDDFACKMGVSRATQMNYEANKTVPDCVYLSRSSELGIDVLELLGIATAIPEPDNKLDKTEIAVELFKLFERYGSAPSHPNQNADFFAALLRFFDETLQPTAIKKS